MNIGRMVSREPPATAAPLNPRAPYREGRLGSTCGGYLPQRRYKVARILLCLTFVFYVFNGTAWSLQPRTPGKNAVKVRSDSPACSSDRWGWLLPYC